MLLLLLFFMCAGTCTYLVGTGKERLLVDTGEGKHHYKDLLAFALQQPPVDPDWDGDAENTLTMPSDTDLEKWSEERSQREVGGTSDCATVAKVCLTHWHGDHTGGLAQVHQLAEALGERGNGAPAVTCYKYPDCHDSQVHWVGLCRLLAG